MNITNKFKFNFNVSEPMKIGNMAVFGLTSTMQTKEEYLCLPEALKNNKALISEVSERGSVSHLKVKNFSAQTILMVEGELIVSTKNARLLQDRVLNTTILVPPYKSVYAPVSCVEKSRWNRFSLRTHRFSVSEDFYFARGRMRKNEDVYHSSRTHGHKYSDQYRVWDTIDEKISKVNAYSSTSSINVAYERKRIEIEETVKKFYAEPKDIGIIFGIGWNLVGCDIFNSNEVFRTYLPKLIRSICMDSYELEKKTSPLQRKDALSFLKLIQQAQFEEHTAINGEGIEVRSNDLILVAQGLFNKEDKSAVHFSAFLKDREIQPEYMIA